MKNTCITYTYHKKAFDIDEEPTKTSLVLPIEDEFEIPLLQADFSTPILARHHNSALHCVCEMI